jgi:hypothetical protein
MRYLNRALALCVFFYAVLFFAPHIALGASASISASPQADGSVPATVTGSFASCPVCDAVDAKGVCIKSHNNTSGSVSLYRDSGFLCSASGSGSASCTKVEDRGGLNGTHVYSATASDCAGSASASYPLTLDNTPTVTVASPSGVISAPFDITGNVTFKPTLSAIKGTVYLYLDNGYFNIYKNCTTENCSFSYQEIAGKLYDMNHGGPHTVKLIAYGGGTSASDQKTFTVDKMPTVTVTAPTGTISAPFDITGNVTFKPTLSAIKGTVYLYLDNGYFKIYKNFNWLEWSF